MRDTELYRHLLGLEDPWTVSRVELKVKEQRVDVWAGHPEGISWACPECGNGRGFAPATAADRAGVERHRVLARADQEMPGGVSHRAHNFL